jgi:hypothetical protein
LNGTHEAEHKTSIDTAVPGHPEFSSALILLYTWNYELFWTSLQSYLVGGLGPHIIIIDNSEDARIVNDAKVAVSFVCPQSMENHLAHIEIIDGVSEENLCGPRRHMTTFQSVHAGNVLCLGTHLQGMLSSRSQ